MSWLGKGCSTLVNGVEVATIQGFECLFEIIIKAVVGFALLAVFIVLIIGGFKFLTSGGDPKAAASAKSTLTYAVFGLVGLVIIWLILKFVEVFTGVSVTQFVIPQ